MSRLGEGNADITAATKTQPDVAAGLKPGRTGISIR